MKTPFRTKPDHRPPEWIDAATYFVTVCTQERGRNQLCSGSATEILASIGVYHEKQRWYCEYAVLMPDHAHFLLGFVDIGYAKVIGDWKRWVATKHGVVWQENFFEHRLRNEDIIDEKARYLMANPVRSGLVDDASKWPFFWQPG